MYPLIILILWYVYPNGMKNTVEIFKNKTKNIFLYAMYYYTYVQDYMNKNDYKNMEIKIYKIIYLNGEYEEDVTNTFPLQNKEGGYYEIIYLNKGKKYRIVIKNINNWNKNIIFKEIENKQGFLSAEIKGENFIDDVTELVNEYLGPNLDFHNNNLLPKDMRLNKKWEELMIMDNEANEYTILPDDKTFGGFITVNKEN
jgi:hypothetical protein